MSARSHSSRLSTLRTVCWEDGNHECRSRTPGWFGYHAPARSIKRRLFWYAPRTWICVLPYGGGITRGGPLDTRILGRHVCTRTRYQRLVLRMYGAHTYVYLMAFCGCRVASNAQPWYPVAQVETYTKQRVIFFYGGYHICHPPVPKSTLPVVQAGVR